MESHHKFWIIIIFLLFAGSMAESVVKEFVNSSAECEVAK